MKFMAAQAPPSPLADRLEKWKPAKYSHIDTSFDNGMHPLIGCVRDWSGD